MRSWVGRSSLGQSSLDGRGRGTAEGDTRLRCPGQAFCCFPSRGVDLPAGRDSRYLLRSRAPLAQASREEHPDPSSWALPRPLSSGGGWRHLHPGRVPWGDGAQEVSPRIGKAGFFLFSNDPAATEISPLSLHAALPTSRATASCTRPSSRPSTPSARSER